MASTYTDNLGLVLPAFGELTETWGTVVNASLTSLVDEAVTGMASLSTWTANAMTITTTDGVSSSGRCLMLSLTGTLTGTGTLTVPTAKKMYIVRNNTTGGYDVTVKMAAGTTVTVPNGETYMVYADGSNVELCLTKIQSAVTADTATTATTAEKLKSNATTGVMQIVGPTAATTRVMTIPDANATILTTNAAVTVAQGGTGLATLTANNVILGNGTGTPLFVAPSTSGNVLMSNGTTWQSTALPSGGSVPAGGTTGQALTKVNATDYNTTWTTVGDVTTTGTQTLTNKRVTPRVSSAANITSPLAWNSDNYDQYCATAQSEALTINADSGTPTDGQKMIFRFLDNSTARALTWTTGASKAFRAVGITLPTTTVLGKVVYVGCVYNANAARWDAIATAQEA